MTKENRHVKKISLLLTAVQEESFFKKLSCLDVTLETSFPCYYPKDGADTLLRTQPKEGSLNPNHIVPGATLTLDFTTADNEFP